MIAGLRICLGFVKMIIIDNFKFSHLVEFVELSVFILVNVVFISLTSTIVKG